MLFSGPFPVYTGVYEVICDIAPAGMLVSGECSCECYCIMLEAWVFVAAFWRPGVISSRLFDKLVLI